MVGCKDMYFRTVSQVLFIAMFGAKWPGWWPREACGQVERLQDPGVGQTWVKDLTLPEHTVKLLNCLRPLCSHLLNEKSGFQIVLKSFIYEASSWFTLGAQCYFPTSSGD